MRGWGLVTPKPVLLTRGTGVAITPRVGPPSDEETTMKRILLTATVVAAIAGGGIALGQSPTPSADDHTVHHPAAAKAPKAATSGEKTGVGQAGMGNAMMGAGNDMGCGMMGGGNGMMGGGNNMMGGRSGMIGGGMCGMMMGAANTKVDIKKIDKGVTVTLTSSDAARIVASRPGTSSA